MGQELECTARWDGRRLTGKAYLETEFVLFRGTERVRIGFKELESVTADGGVLRLSFAGGLLELELGKAAEKWREKILHPPSRLAKLGVGAGVRVRLVGPFDADFEAELKASKCELDAETRRRGDAGMKASAFSPRPRVSASPCPLSNTTAFRVGIGMPL